MRAMAERAALDGDNEGAVQLASDQSRPAGLGGHSEGRVLRERLREAAITG